MAILFDAPVDPVELTTFVRNVPQNPDPNAPIRPLSAIFPVKYLETNTVDFAEIVKTNRVAKYRSFDGRIHVSERDVGSEKRVRLAPLSSSIGMGEYERLQLEFARTGGTRTEALANSIYNDGDNLTNEVWNRLELAWGDVLTDGKLTINDEGFMSEADFGVAALGNLVAPAGALWSNTAAALVLTDCITWRDAYTAVAGARPGRLRTSQAVLTLMQTNVQIINAVHGSAAGRTRVTLTELRDLFSSEGLPYVEDPWDGFLDVDGVTTRTIPDDRVMFLPPNVASLGYTAFGVSATALELVNSNVADFSFEQAAGIVGVVEKVGPPYRQFTFVDAVAMPILINPRLLLVADVK